MKHGASRELYDYWTRMRGNDRAPQRSAIEPSDLRRILPDTFIVEVVDRDRYFVRLAGTRVCAIYCREIKGTNLIDLWQAEDRSAMATLAAAVSEDGAAAVVTIAARTAKNDDVACELILLPLRHGGVTTFDRMIGSLAVLERPYWLGNEPVIHQTITSLRLIWPDERPSFMRRKGDAVQDFVPPQPIVRRARNARRRGHLFILDGGKD
ncbi:MAG: PAS domain-containing protein [Bauldia sp.]